MSNTTHQQAKRLGRSIFRNPVAFKNWIQRQGPIFIKVGQYLALRPDLIDQSYCDELMTLSDKVPAFSWEKAEKILIKELGSDYAYEFEFIEPKPIGAGSLAQTHYAKLKNGTEVAVKILRPGIKKALKRNLRRLRMLARSLSAIQASFIESPDSVLTEISDWLWQETDLKHELENIERMWHLTKENDAQVVPQAFPEHSTSRVLTMEYVKGIPFTEIYNAVQHGDTTNLTRLREAGYDPHELGERLIQANLTQVFDYQFFHADLHPGNLVALPGNKIGFVDFGLCDEVHYQVRDEQLRYFYAITSGNENEMINALSEILIADDITDFEQFRRDFSRNTQEYSSEIRREKTNVNPMDPTVYSPFNLMLQGLMRAIRKNRLKVPTQILAMYRAILTAEHVATGLDAEIDIRDLGKQVLGRIQRQKILEEFNLRKVQSFLYNVFRLVIDSPGRINQLLTDLTNDQFALKVVNSESPRTRLFQNRRTKLLSSSIMFCGLAVLYAGDIGKAIPGFFVKEILLGLMTATALIVVILWRKLQ